MTKSIAIVAAALLLVVAAAAQDVPRAEVFLGYTYQRTNSATDVPAFSANGGGGQFVLNLGKWIGAVADLGATHNGNIGGYHLDTTMTHFLFGPRVPIRVHSRVTPYFQMLWGGVYASTSVNVRVPDDIASTLPPMAIPPMALPPRPGDAVSLRASAQQTAFAMTLGGGLDIKINKIVSFRPIGLDWYMTRLQNLRSMNDNNQHHIRYTTGFNFTLGAQ
jgi:opacity protein-like surface antigen